MNFITIFLNTQLVTPLLNLLTQGITPEKLALSVGLGVSLGIFPMLGSTTILCAVFGFLFRVYQPAIQVVNYFTYPLQLILLIPFSNRADPIFDSRNSLHARIRHGRHDPGSVDSQSARRRCMASRRPFAHSRDLPDLSPHFYTTRSGKVLIRAAFPCGLHGKFGSHSERALP
jgi:hypothetical protein